MFLYNNKDYTSKNVLKQMAMTVLILQFTGRVKSNIITQTQEQGRGMEKASFHILILHFCLLHQMKEILVLIQKHSLAGLYWIKILYFDHFIADSRLKYM